MDRGAWQATVRGATQSPTWLRRVGTQAHKACSVLTWYTYVLCSDYHGRAFKIYSLTLFQVYNAVLSSIISLPPWIPRTDLSCNWKFAVSGLRCKSLFRVRLIFCEWCKVLVQSLSHVWLFTTPWTAAHQASLSFTISQSLFKPLSVEPTMPSNHLVFCCPLLLPASVFPSIRVFSIESALHIRWPKYWSSNFNVSPSSEYSGLISFRMD